MTIDDRGDPGRFSLLAAAVAGRSIGMAVGAADREPYTDGRSIFVAGDAPADEQRRAVVLQAALLGAGSLDPEILRALRGRPRIARRFLAVEGRRVLADLTRTFPSLATDDAGAATTASPAASLLVAQGRASVPDAPRWFGVIRPSRLSREALDQAAATPAGEDPLSAVEQEDRADEDDDVDPTDDATGQKKTQNPLGSSALAHWIANRLGLDTSHRQGGGEGAGMPIRSIRRLHRVGPGTRSLPPSAPAGPDDQFGALVGVGGGRYPEWNVHSRSYRDDWCRVVELPLRPSPEGASDRVEHDDILRRRLARLGLGPRVLRRRPDGDDIDIDALIDLAIDQRAGHCGAENIYLESRKVARNLGVLILLDVSGSATDADSSSRSVHDHQCRAAATLARTLEELGDRVAIYGFRSLGRSAVQMLAIKSFDRRFGAEERARLNSIEPDGYTRLGAAIRHAGTILGAKAGTPNRLLVVLSDGFPYDDGYEATYAEADTCRALEELRAEEVACLCLSIGASTPEADLERVFGSASLASGPTLADLSPRMDELFLSALRELAVGQRRVLVRRS